MRRRYILLAALVLLGSACRADDAAAHWSRARAAEWYARQPWIVGVNYIPANAVNQLEMWQEDSFDPARIDTELGWAQALGFNTVRVFLHDLLWQQDPDGFLKRIDIFLGIASKHGIRTMLVLFDSCWNPEAELGPQPAPRPHIHNSGWVQSPPARELADPSAYPKLESYVKGVVGRFANDPRVLAWDVWNEPTNDNSLNYPGKEAPDKERRVVKLMAKAFAWVRSAHPTQPLTSALWLTETDWSSLKKMRPVERLQIRESDFLSFHNYMPPEGFERHLGWLRRFGRPVVVSEYLARGAGSTIEAILPLAKREGVGALSWGLVAGKTQTIYPWDSLQKPYSSPPALWHHDLLNGDGSPFSPAETSLIKNLTR